MGTVGPSTSESSCGKKLPNVQSAKMGKTSNSVRLDHAGLRSGEEWGGFPGVNRMGQYTLYCAYIDYIMYTEGYENRCSSPESVTAVQQGLSRGNHSM